MAESARVFIPAAGRDWLLPLYDPLTRLLGFDDARKELVAQAALHPLQRVLDIGCGTGAVAILVKTLHPSVEVTGLDPDQRALARAARKALRAGLSVRWEHGFSDALPFPEATFDRVVSSMMLHHLQRAEKEKTVQEVRRVLKPGGRFHLLDFSSPELQTENRLARRLHSHALLRDNSESQLLTLLAGAELADVKKRSERRTLFGTIAYYQASRPLRGAA